MMEMHQLGGVIKLLNRKRFLGELRTRTKADRFLQNPLRG